MDAPIKNTFWVIATPIGNLDDLSLRARMALSQSNFVIAENSLQAKKLLSFLETKKTIVSYTEHTSTAKLDQIIQKINDEGPSCFIVSRGTPGIADPGGALIQRLWALKNTGKLEVKISPIPGPSAITAALSISGFPANQFVFLGFPPKRKRQRWFNVFSQLSYTVVFFESPYRIIKTLKDLQAVITDERPICLARELTKQFEELLWGNCSEIIGQLIAKKAIKGEFTVAVAPPAYHQLKH